MSTENAAVVEAVETEASESIQAGYDRIANPEKAREYQPVAKTEPVEKVAAPTAETPLEAPTFTGEQIKDVMAQLSRIPELEKRLRDEGGRYGILKQSLDQLQQSMKTTTAGDPAAVDDMLKGIKDEFGDDNPLYLSLKEAFSKVVAGKSIDPEVVKTLVSEQIAANRQADEETAAALLAEERPTWEKDVQSPEFKEWAATLPDKERNRIKRSNDPDFIADKLDVFDAWKAAKAKEKEPKAEVVKLEAKPSARLLKAVMPTTGSKAKPAAEDDTKASIRAGYERVAGARR